MPFRPSPTGARPFAAVALAVASLVTAAAAGSIFLQTARDAGAAIVADGPASPVDGILGAVALLGTVLSLWVGLGLALSALSALPGATGRACTQLADRHYIIEQGSIVYSANNADFLADVAVKDRYLGVGLV